MSYDYQTERPKLFTEDGVRTLMIAKKSIDYLLKLAGAVKYSSIKFGGLADGDWMQMAVCDYLIETQEIREITGNVPGQHRVFVRV